MYNKKNDVNEIMNYDDVFQNYLLGIIYSNPEIYTRCKNILKPEYFDMKFQKSVKVVNEYSDKHSCIPDEDYISIKAQFEFKPRKIDELHADGILEEVGKFCKHKALENAIVEGSKCLSERKYSMIEQLVKDAMMVSLQTDMGLDIFANPKEVIQRLKEEQGNVSSGWETLDFKLYGGFGTEELNIVAAMSGGGKSVWLQNMAVNQSLLGKNGAYISLELKEELVGVRLYAMFDDKAVYRVKEEAFETDASLKRIRLEEEAGDIYVKRLPESVTTVNDVEAYLRELQIRTGIKLDYVCVDYLDLLSTDKVSNASDTFTKDKFVSEELRAMAMKLKLTVFSASQFNRSGISDSDSRSQGQIAGGISKVYTADNLIFLEAKRDTGEMIFEFMKTRNAGAVGSKLRMAYNVDSLRILDHDMTIAELKEKFKFKPSPNLKVGSSSISSAMTSNTSSKLQSELQAKIRKGSPEHEPEQPTKNAEDVINNRIDQMKNFLNKRK